jgi:polyhydroxybutyrate depolymerase
VAGRVLLAVAVLCAVATPGCSLFEGVDLGVAGIDSHYVDVPSTAGDDRSVLVVQSDQLAEAKDPSPVPLVVVLHGFQSDAEVMAKITAFAAEAGQKNFVAAFGVGLDKSWNAELCCGASAANETDDVAYLRALILTVEEQFPVDRSKVFFLGYSNCGMMAYRMLCESPELVTSFVSVAGTNTSGCRATTPRPFLQISGDDDPIVPIAGSTSPTAPGVGPTPSVQGSIAGVADDFDCPKPQQQVVGPVTEQRWAPCREGVQVVFDIVKGAGHGWPTGEPFATTQRALQFWGLV